MCSEQTSAAQSGGQLRLARGVRESTGLEVPQTKGRGEVEAREAVPEGLDTTEQAECTEHNKGSVAGLQAVEAGPADKLGETTRCHGAEAA